MSTHLGPFLHESVTRINLKGVKGMLQEGADPNYLLNGKYPLHKVTQKGHIAPQIAELLIKSGANPNTKDNYGNTPLHTISYHNRLKTAKVLLDAGANPNATNLNFQTPLYAAAKHISPRMASLLIRHGAKVNVTDSTLTTPLHISVQFDRISTIQYLISQGADLTAKDKLGQIPFDYVDPTTLMIIKAKNEVYESLRPQN